MSRLEELIQELCPEGVEYKKVKEFATCVAGATPSKNKRAFWENGTIPWMSSGEVNKGEIFDTEERITQEGYAHSSTKMIPPNTVVMALAGQGKTRGMVAITRIELCTNQSLCSFVTDSTIKPEFLLHYFKSQYEQLRKSSNGDKEGARGGLNLGILREYVVPVPPLPVQEEIVSILDHFTAFTGKLQRELKGELEARKNQYEYYKGTLLSFVNRRDVPRMKLNDVCTLQSGGTPSKSNADYWEKGTIKWLSSTVCKNRKVIDDVTDYITELGLKKSSAKMMKSGTTLIALVGATIGKLGFLTFDAAINQNVAGVYPKDMKVILPEYVYYICGTLYGRFLSISNGKLAMANMSFVRGLEIPVPSIDEQKKIISILNQFEELNENMLTRILAELEARQKQYEFYRDKLLTFKEKSC